MKRKKDLLLPDTVGHSGLFPLIGKLLLLLSLGIALIPGCDLDRDRDAEPPVIGTLAFTSPIKVQAPMDVAAEVLLNKEDLDLSYEYDWSATEGQITNNGALDTYRISAITTDSKDKTKGRKRGDKDSSVTAMATYIAPKTPGIYTITLKVCTRYAVVEKSINVEVTDDIIDSFSFAYWKANGNEQSLTYRFKVSAIRRSPILLRYEIQQDSGQLGADLMIKIGKKQVEEKRISNAPPRTDALISGQVNITEYIDCPEQYELTFTLKTDEVIVKKAWLLQSVQIVGVEGAFLP